MNSKILFLAVFLALAFIVKAQYDEDGTSTSTDASYYDYDYVKKRSIVNKSPKTQFYWHNNFNYSEIRINIRNLKLFDQ